MRNRLLKFTGKLFVIILLMSGANFSRHYCMPEPTGKQVRMIADCCGSDCSSSESIPSSGNNEPSCCKWVESFLYIPVYSVNRTSSPQPTELTLALHSFVVQCVLLEGPEVSFAPEIALKGEPPGPDLHRLRVFRI